MVHTRSSGSRTQDQNYDTFQQLNEREQTGKGSRVTKMLTRLVQRNAERDDKTKYFGAHSVREREVVREVEVHHDGGVQYVEVPVENGFLKSLRSMSSKAMNVLGTYLTTSSVVSCATHAASTVLSPLVPVVTFPALYAAGKKDLLSPDVIAGLGLGILAAASDSENYFEAEDYTQRIYALAGGAIIVLFANLIKPRAGE